MEGNQQKMREAIVALIDALDSLGCDEETATLAAFVPDMADSSEKCLAAFRKAKEALSAPPRNCDLPLVVDGPANNNADKAWLVFKYRNPDAYFDVSGLLRCIDWLLSPAAEKQITCIRSR